MEPLLVLWDIDGTLIRSGEVAAAIFEVALETIVGTAPSARVRMSGKTDPEIMREYLVALGLPEDQDLIAAALKVDCSAGELSWGGAASTAFWIDQAEGITVSFFTQLIPSNAYPLRPQLRQLVYQSIV